MNVDDPFYAIVGAIRKNQGGSIGGACASTAECNTLVFVISRHNPIENKSRKKE